MGRQRRKPQNKSFKKDINQQVTWADQKAAKVRDRIRDSKYETADTNNDPEWYAKDPSLLRDAASIPFAWPTGIKVRLSGSLTQGYNLDLVVPGVLTQELVPTCGLATT